MSRFALAFLVLSAACGTAEPGGGGDGGTQTPDTGAPSPDGAGSADAGPIQCAPEGRYLPLVTGATWTYQVTDPLPETKTSSVGAIEDVGGVKAGVQAHRVTTTKTGGSTVSWQEDTGTAIVRHRELDMSGTTQVDEVYEPYKLRVDEAAAHLVAGATWTETYIETSTDLASGNETTASKSETWTVMAVDEPVTVPAGTFCALRLHRVSTVSGGTGGSDKTFWFARGVGKVKETGGQTEELSSYTIP